MLPRRARGRRRTLACALTVEQAQQFHRSSARYERVVTEGFEPTVLEQRTPMDMGLPAWSTMDNDVFSACPPEVWDLTTDRWGDRPDVWDEVTA